MSRAFAVQLAEVLDVVHRNRRFAQRFIFRIDGLHSSKMQQPIKQHGGMSVGKDKAVAVGPDGIFRVVTEKALPKDVRHGRQGHGRSGMAGIGLLYRVHGESAEGVDAELVNIACIFNVFCLIGNFWQSYGKSHSLKQPPTDKPTLNWGHLGSVEALFERCWAKE